MANLEAVARRVLAEFEEMPGMVLTRRQGCSTSCSTPRTSANRAEDRSGWAIESLRRELLPSRSIDVRGLAEEDLGRLHHGLGQRRVRVN